MLSWPLGDAKLKSLLLYNQLLRKHLRSTNPRQWGKMGEGHHHNVPTCLSYMPAIKSYCSQVSLIIYTGGGNNNLIDLDNHILNQYF